MANQAMRNGTETPLVIRYCHCGYPARVKFTKMKHLKLACPVTKSSGLQGCDYYVDF